MDQRKVGNYSPKGGSVVNLNIDDEDEEINLKPNHVEKLSLALAHSLKDPVLKPRHTESKSAKSDNEDSISIREEFENSISDVYNDKLKRELELTLTDLRKLRTEYEELTHLNLQYK